jgi:glucose/mannose-6-phosphate isomerase
VTDLDDVQGLRAIDASDMLGIIAGLASQCRAGYDVGRDVRPVPAVDGVTAVTYCGMGGSAVAGDVLRSVFRGELTVPVDVNRSPELPRSAGTDTLVIAASYSGNTAETLDAFSQALERECRAMALTSGGQLADIADASGVPVVHVPGGLMPRAALGYLAFGLLGALEVAGLLSGLASAVDEVRARVDAFSDALGPDTPTSHNAAKALAIRIGERVPVVWGAEGFAAIAANRWRTQFNENAKVPAFSAALPELDHNEVVGWSGGRGDGFFLVALRHEGEHPDVAARFPLSLEIARDAGVEVAEVQASGRSDLARLMSLVVIGDHVSTYLGIARGVDPSPIEAIARLKAALAEP